MACEALSDKGQGLPTATRVCQQPGRRLVRGLDQGSGSSLLWSRVKFTRNTAPRSRSGVAPGCLHLHKGAATTGAVPRRPEILSIQPFSGKVH